MGQAADVWSLRSSLTFLPSVWDLAKRKHKCLCFLQFIMVTALDGKLNTGRVLCIYCWHLIVEIASLTQAGASETWHHQQHQSAICLERISQSLELSHRGTTNLTNLRYSVAKAKRSLPILKMDIMLKYQPHHDSNSKCFFLLHLRGITESTEISDYNYCYGEKDDVEGMWLYAQGILRSGRCFQIF